MRILVVTASIDPASGGPTRSCKGLCRALSQAGEDVTLLVLDGMHPFEKPCGVKVVYANKKPFTEVLPPLGQYSLVHIQGLWQWGLHKVARACRRAGVPYVISPRGMLDPWALSVKKWKKRLALFLYQRRDLEKAAGFHVTATMERDHLRALGFTHPYVIAPNGVEFPDVLPEKRPRNVGDTKVAIFLSRLHPGKGLLTLAEAWAQVSPKGWVMKIVGPDNYGHKAEVIAKLDSLGIPYFQNDSQCQYTSEEQLQKGNVQSSSYWLFYDAVNDTQKWEAYRAADLLVHPSVSENFGITIAEALYAGLPVICTKGTPWSEVEGNNGIQGEDDSNTLVSGKCGWWIDQGVDALAMALREATSCAYLGVLGENGHRLAVSRYIWSSISQIMIAGYKSILANVK